MPIPTVILVTGAPGSGKSTLARQLGVAMRVPVLARDDVRGGLFLTNGAWSSTLESVPAADDATDAFLALVERFVGAGVSCVAEYVVRANRSDHLARLRAGARLVVVTTTCHDPLARVADRNRRDRLVNRRTVLAALGFATIEEHTAAVVERMRQVEREMLTEFDAPTLVVDTSDGYVPALDAVVDFVAGSSSATS